MLQSKRHEEASGSVSGGVFGLSLIGRFIQGAAEAGFLVVSWSLIKPIKGLLSMFVKLAKNWINVQQSYLRSIANNLIFGLEDPFMLGMLPFMGFAEFFAALLGKRSIMKRWWKMRWEEMSKRVLYQYPLEPIKIIKTIAKLMAAIVVMFLVYTAEHPALHYAGMVGGLLHLTLFILSAAVQAHTVVVHVIGGTTVAFVARMFVSVHRFIGKLLRGLFVDADKEVVG